MAANLSKNIVLIGMMGAGKTTVASLLAEKIEKFLLVDLDEKIELSSGMKISEIFEKYGESYFRKLETQTVKEISSENNLIISTGGGIVCKAENIDLLKKNGVVFYLSATAQTLFERVKNSTHRPLLKNENPQKILEELLKVREPLYKTADFEINTENIEPEEIIEKIIEKYETKI